VDIIPEVDTIPEVVIILEVDIMQRAMKDGLLVSCKLRIGK